MADDPKPTEETHDLFLPDVPIVMPKGELPVVREGTVGGVPSYAADRPRSCGCKANDLCLHGIPAVIGASEDFPITWRPEYLGISRETK